MIIGTNLICPKNLKKLGQTYCIILYAILQYCNIEILHF